MADAQDTSSSTSNIIPFRPRERSAVAAQPDDEIQFVTVIWPRSGLGDCIRCGDILEIDMAAKTVHHDGVFVVETPGGPQLRRVQRDILDGSLLVGDDRAPAQRVARDQLRVVGAITQHWRAQ